MGLYQRLYIAYFHFCDGSINTKVHRFHRRKIQRQQKCDNSVLLDLDVLLYTKMDVYQQLRGKIVCKTIKVQFLGHFSHCPSFFLYGVVQYVLPALCALTHTQ